MENQQPDAAPAAPQIPMDTVQIRMAFLNAMISQMFQLRLIPPGLEFANVAEFHNKIGLMINDHPVHLTKRKLVERIQFMLEELLEFCKASSLVVEIAPEVESYEGGSEFTGEHVVRVTPLNSDQDMVEQADALVDLAYVVLGTAVMMGLPWGALWNEVQRSNMDKVPGETKRHHRVDAMKPPGWVGPRIREILAYFKYDRNEFTNEQDAIDDEKCRDD